MRACCCIDFTFLLHVVVFLFYFSFRNITIFMFYLFENLESCNKYYYFAFFNMSLLFAIFYLFSFAFFCVQMKSIILFNASSANCIRARSNQVEKLCAVLSLSFSYGIAFYYNVYVYLLLKYFL